jgi:hypothetical protein
MGKGRIIEEKTKTISGKELSTLLGVQPKDFMVLYPRRKEPGYCPCIDLGVKECKGMRKAVNLLTRNEISEFPYGTARVIDGEYKSGEVWIDEHNNLAYLYIGKSPSGRDVVLNLGGNICVQGNIMVGYINNEKRLEKLYFDKKVFPL